MKTSSPSTSKDSNSAASRLVVSPKLYGRDQELEVLLRAFEKVGAGEGIVLMAAGSSGAGKTTLVQTLREPVLKKNGFFLQGKFNQYQQGVPLFGIRQALRGLVLDLLSAAPPERDEWKAKILQAVGNLGGVLTGLIPDLGQLLGPQPAAPAISPSDASHRFLTVVQNFLAVFCRAEHPVVLFVDDWQWADAASLTMLRQLQINTALRYFLLVISYRDDEVDATHPLTDAVRGLHHRTVPILKLPVRNLGVAEVTALLADTLQPAVEDLEKLATLTHKHTQGNPFFVWTLLDFLNKRRAIRFDQVCQSWRWDAKLVTEAAGTNVVHLFVLKLRLLPPESGRLLSLAACIGNRFDLGTLATAGKLSQAECLAGLRSALEEHLIVSLNDNPGGLPAETRGAPDDFVFQHDRVQQAAHSLIAPEDLPKVRLRIGRLLVSSLSPDQLDAKLLEVTDHLNAGRGLLQKEAEQAELVRLNIAAADRAFASTAYRAALQFHRAAGELFANPKAAAKFWSRHHDLAFQLFKGWAETEFIEGDRIQSERCVNAAAARARTPLEQANALGILIVHYTLLARYPEAIAIGRQALTALGITLPDADFESARDVEIARVRQRLAHRSVASFREVPVMSDPTILMATKLLITMGPPCYRSHQRLWGVIVAKVVDLTLQYGSVPQVGYSHTAFGGLLGWVDNDYATAREFGELATGLMTNVFCQPSDQSVFYLMMGSSLRHWFGPMTAASHDYAQAWETGLRSGNLQYAAYAFGHNMYCRFFQGAPLATLIKESRQSLDFSRTRTNQWAIDLLEGGLQVFGTLAETAVAKDATEPWSEEEYLKQVDTHKNIQVACIYRVLKAGSLLMLGQHERALAVSDEAEPLIYTVGMQGLLPWPEHVFIRLLLLTALHPGAKPDRQTTWRSGIDRAMNQLQIWANHSPENYNHKYLFAQAEVARLEGRTADAFRFYEQAIEAARTSHFCQWEGMANERAASLSQTCGQERLMQIYWQEAYSCFCRWGAGAKLRLMEAEILASVSFGSPNAPVPRTAKGKQTCKILNARLEQRFQALRTQACQAVTSQSQPDSTQVIGDLSRATEHLREENANRKRMEVELRQKQSLLAETNAAALNLMEDIVHARNQVEQTNSQLRQINQQLEQRVAERTKELSQEVSERKQAEETARRSEAQHRLLLDSTAEGIYGIDMGGNCTFVNPACLRLLGYKHADELLGKNMHWQIHHRRADGTFFPVEQCQIFHAFLKGEGTHVDNEVLWRADGTSFPVEYWSYPQRHDGVVVGAVVTFVDISKRKQAEASLSVVTDRLTLATRAGGVGVWDYDVVNNRLVWDDQMFHLYGITRDQFGGAYSAWQAGLHPEDRQRGDEEIQRALRGEKDFDTEFRVVWPDGSIHDIRALAILRCDASGKPLHLIGTNWDITAQKQTETQLRKLQSAVEQGPASVMITDVKGKIEYVNPRFTLQTGYTAAEAMGRSPGFLKSGVHSREFYETFWGTLLSGQIWRGELCNKRKDGTLFWESASIAPIRNRGSQPTHFVAVREDITERRRMMEELRQAKEEADAANKAKSQFLARMSHEIRTPLNAVLGFAQLMLRDSSLVATQRSRLEAISSNGEHLLALITEVLDMSKIETGRLALQTSSFDLPDLFEDVQIMFRARAQTRQLQFDMEVAAGIPRYVCGDRGKIQQVFVNLIGNAIKFTNRGGVMVRVREAEEKGRLQRIRVEIEDTGRGISPEEIDQLFQPFAQAGKGLQSGAGSGLGLYISRQFVQLMGGEITATSQVGVGSLFRFDFVVELSASSFASEEKEMGVVKALRPDQPPCRVLIVDDVKDNRALLDQMLSSAGFVCHQATDGLGALAGLKEWKPQLILMDVHMPRMDGNETIRRIRAGAEGRDVKIIGITASAFEDDRQATLGAGADGFLAKPISREGLLEQIKALLGVEYLYEDEPATRARGSDSSQPGLLTRESMASLPAALLKQIHEAVVIADFDRVMELIQQVEAQAPPVAHSLRQLAEQFDSEKLLELTETKTT